MEFSRIWRTHAPTAPTKDKEKFKFLQLISRISVVRPVRHTLPRRTGCIFTWLAYLYAKVVVRNIITEDVHAYGCPVLRKYIRRLRRFIALRKWIKVKMCGLYKWIFHMKSSVSRHYLHKASNNNYYYEWPLIIEKNAIKN